MKLIVNTVLLLSVLVCFFVAMIKTLTKSNLGKKAYSSLALPNCNTSLREGKAGTYGRNLEAETEAGTNEQCCLPASSVWHQGAMLLTGLLSLLSYITEDYLQGLDPPTSVVTHENVPTDQLDDRNSSTEGSFFQCDPILC